MQNEQTVASGQNRVKLGNIVTLPQSPSRIDDVCDSNHKKKPSEQS